MVLSDGFREQRAKVMNGRRVVLGSSALRHAQDMPTKEVPGALAVTLNPKPSTRKPKP